MNEGESRSSSSALISLLESITATEGAHAFVHVVIYTRFGVVRGRTGLSFVQGITGRQTAETSQEKAMKSVIELHDVTVEHYSNHLPTASFDRLYVPLEGVQGFAIAGSQQS